MASTVGNGTSDFTAGSQDCAASARVRPSPVSAALPGSACQRAASTTCTGQTLAISTWVSSGSGYSAIGASRASSCWLPKTESPAGWAPAG